MMPGMELNEKDNQNDNNQYVSFNIGNEIFGLEVMKVQEVLGQIKLTSVPNTMPYMKGVIDLRETIVPVIDLRLKFKIKEKEYGSATVVIISEIKGLLLGLIVDSVSDVISLTESQIQKTPHFSSEIESDAVIGIGKHNEKIIIIIDADKIFKSDELEILVQK